MNLVLHASAAEEEYDEDEYMDFDPYLFIRKLPPLASVVTPVREVLLPRQVQVLSNPEKAWLSLTHKSASWPHWTAS